MTTRTALDTSVLVAALVSWHESHAAALETIDEAQKAGALLLPADALVETFSVLTRLPSGHRLSPADAHGLLAKNFAHERTAALTGAETWSLLKGLVADGVSGGATYDARIVAAAVKGKAQRILTLNTRHFERLAPPEMEVLGLPGG